MKVTRRSFLRKTSAGIAATTALPVVGLGMVRALVRRTLLELGGAAG